VGQFLNPTKKSFAESDVVLLVDDHEIVRYGMRLMIEALGCTVLEAGSGEESIELVRKHKIDLVFMDIALPGMDGVTASMRLLQADDKLNVTILTALPVGSVPKNILRSGVVGCMTKSAAADEIEQAIGRALDGQLYLSPSIANQLALDSIQHESGEISPFGNLSRREFQVVLLLMKGYRNDDAGDALRLSVKTISTYKHRAYEKLGVTSTAELMKLATCWGFVEP